MQRTGFVFLCLSVWTGWCVAQTPGGAPQRTVTPGEQPAARSADAEPEFDPAIESQIRESIARYRQTWDRMSAGSRRMVLQNGGYTPEQYERMMREALRTRYKPSVKPPAQTGEAVGPAPTRPPARRPDYSEGPNLDALQTLSTSTEDLNALRDRNLQRVQKSECPPEVVSRIADLKGKLASQEAALAGGVAPAETPRTEPAKPPAPNSAQALAADWFKKPPDTAAVAGSQPGAAADSKGQLDSVLGGGAAGRPNLAPARSPASEKQRAEIEQEIARIKAELGRLSVVCPAGK